VNLDPHYSFQSVGASIVVRASAADSYQHWTHVEEFPQFMGAVREIKSINGDRFYWRVERGGQEYESVSQIVLRIPNRRMAWRTVSGAESAGVVGFDPLSNDTTLVSFKMKYATGAGWGDPADLLQRVRRRLENFKTYIESLPGAAKENQT
jgi:uncharacterized membrane protein